MGLWAFTTVRFEIFDSWQHAHAHASMGLWAFTTVRSGYIQYWYRSHQLQWGCGLSPQCDDDRG